MMQASDTSHSCLPLELGAACSSRPAASTGCLITLNRASPLAWGPWHPLLLGKLHLPGWGPHQVEAGMCQGT